MNSTQNLTKKQYTETSKKKHTYVVFSIFCIIEILINITIIINMPLDYKYLHFNWNIYFKYDFVNLVAIPMIINFIWFLAIKYRKKVTSIICTILSVVLVLYLALLLFLAGDGLFYSETTKTDDYLDFDKDINDYKENIMQIFPDEIPKQVSNVTYYYNYIYYTLSYSHYDVNVMALWKYPDNEQVLEERDLLLKEYSFTETESRGNYILYYLKKKDWHRTSIDNEVYHTYDYILFAINESTNTIRYVASYKSDYYSKDYLDTLSWE